MYMLYAVIFLAWISGKKKLALRLPSHLYNSQPCVMKVDANHTNSWTFFIQNITFAADVCVGKKWTWKNLKIFFLISVAWLHLEMKQKICNIRLTTLKCSLLGGLAIFFPHYSNTLNKQQISLIEFIKHKILDGKFVCKTLSVKTIQNH